VEQLENVSFEHSTTSDGLALDGERVAGVRVAGQTLEADLVVDCSGRGSRLVAWLEDAGFPAPPVTELVVDVGYQVITLERRPDDLGGATVAVVQNIAARMTRLGLAVAVEDERWMVLLGGYFGDLAPSDRAGYLAFADSLPVPDLGQLLRARPPIGEPLPYRFRSSRRVHVERATRWPAGLVALGDATCSFNPLYGQGMSIALLQAEHLGGALDREVPASRLARSIQDQLARITDLAWNIAAGGDLAYPQVEGKRGPIAGTLRRYMTRVFRACSVDAAVVDAVYDVTNLVEPPTRLLRPAMIARVLRAQRHWRRAARMPALVPART
jgi:2-polyprenyl-6-methoxyphenol hydroxylase-like FAD-dependent oxidoreductase